MATLKTSVTSCKVRGRKFWRVRWHEHGKVRRKFFVSKDAADAEAAKIRGEQLGVNQFWAALPHADRERIVMVWNETQRRGIGLLTLLAGADEKPVAVTSPTIQSVITEILEVKEKANRAKDYVSSLKGILNKFAKGRESLPMSKIQLKDLEAFLDGHNISSRSTLRSRLSTWFKFAVRRGYCQTNLCERLESVRIAKPPPQVFKQAELDKCLEWLKANPRALAWFALSTFAGLRPEEAQKTAWNKINFTEKFIRVEEQTSKVTERRVVYPIDTAIEWLRLAKRLKSQLPLTSKQLQKERNLFRVACGFKKWPQDITRHTAASMWLAHTGDATKVAHQLGHSERILHRNYKALVTQKLAAKFWETKP